MEPLNEIIDNLFLGDHVASESQFILSRHRITHILTVGTGLVPRYPKYYQYKCIDELDSPSSNLKQHFEECHSFIRDALASGGRILVHCFAGVSRSATVVISYLMNDHKMTLE